MSVGPVNNSPQIRRNTEAQGTVTKSEALTAAKEVEKAPVSQATQEVVRGIRNAAEQVLAAAIQRQPVPTTIDPNDIATGRTRTTGRGTRGGVQTTQGLGGGSSDIA